MAQVSIEMSSELEKAFNEYRRWRESEGEPLSPEEALTRLVTEGLEDHNIYIEEGAV